MSDKHCTWTQDWEGGTWSGSCGLAFCFNDDGPKENSFNFCPKCGLPVVAEPFTEKEDEE